MLHGLRVCIQAGDLSAHRYPIRTAGGDAILPPIEYSCHYQINSCNMHLNGAIILSLQCGMNSESISTLGTFPHIDIPFGLPEVMQYCPLRNNQATIKQIVVLNK
jgi:hypothetical protein